MWLWLWLLPWISAVKIDIEKGTDGAGKWINASAEEGLQKGTILLSLAGAFRWPGLTRQFSIQSQDADLFEVTQSGEIALTRNLDFEELCTAQPCNVDSKIAVLPQNTYETIKFSLFISNRNDYSPQFPRSLAQISIPESYPVGARFEISDLAATDGDFLDQEDLKYKLIPDDLFRVESDGERLFLVPTQQLDRETTSFVKARLEVSDPGGKRDSLQVEINILDSNDNTPKFPEQIKNLDIQENLAIGSEIFKFEAYDADVGVNSALKYRIVSSLPSEAKRLFELDSSTGRLMVKKAIHRHDFSSIALKITATDNGLPPRSTETSLHLTVLDKNDNAPVITLTPVFQSIADPKVAIVDENQPPGKFVAWLSVSDKDFGKNGEVTMEVEPKELFAIENGSIVSKRNFDREAKDSYKLVVKACDLGSPKRCSSEEMQIKIGDVNDNSPEFAEPLIRTNLKEDLPVGSSIVKVFAVDLDDPAKFGKIKFELSGDESFGIDAETGMIFLKKELDYEAVDFYKLDVTATDIDGNMDSTIVEITIINVNDNAPEIGIGEFVQISKEHDISKPIASLQVSDADGTIPITLLTGESAPFFRLSGDELFLNSQFDKNFDKFLTIVARDVENQSSFVEKTIRISTSGAISAAVGAGIACGVSAVLLVACLVLIRQCQLKKRYKLYDQISRSGKSGNPTNQREDQLCTAQSIGTLSETGKSSARHGSIGPISGRHDSDSGRGESGSETHLGPPWTGSNNLVNLSKFCNQECLTLGHSDACWLGPQEAEKYEVEVSRGHVTSLSVSVWDETSDYSSHNEESEKGKKINGIRISPKSVVV
ncbi:unnamed protein product [Oikopleura dioica]|uniref:Cadherin domain-containing protein n=1 Tax=Oikopleura dioica TaxID=34765 RepID=E4YBY3_OIKDI|nr:unnamed protein product [Oikopleura dioica]